MKERELQRKNKGIVKEKKKKKGKKGF